MFRSVHNQPLYNLVVQHFKSKKIIESIQDILSQLRIPAFRIISSNLIQGSWNVPKYNELMNQRFNVRAIISITETL